MPALFLCSLPCCLTGTVSFRHLSRLTTGGFAAGVLLAVRVYVCLGGACARSSLQCLCMWFRIGYVCLSQRVSAAMGSVFKHLCVCVYVSFMPHLSTHSFLLWSWGNWTVYMVAEHITFPPTVLMQLTGARLYSWRTSTAAASSVVSHDTSCMCTSALVSVFVLWEQLRFLKWIEIQTEYATNKQTRSHLLYNCCRQCWNINRNAARLTY